MWSTLEYGFQVAFEEAWAAYGQGSLPIGACIVDTEGGVAARGRNQVYSAGPGILSSHEMAHAEMNALLAISSAQSKAMHPRIREYTLYSTLEPCPMCFGAVVMSSIRHVRFAARDSWAGAAALNGALEYIQRKSIRVEGPVAGPQAVSVALHICWFIEQLHDRPAAKKYLPMWEPDSPAGHGVGVKLAAEGELRRLARDGAPIDMVYNLIAARCKAKYI